MRAGNGSCRGATAGLSPENMLYVASRIDPDDPSARVIRWRFPRPEVQKAQEGDPAADLAAALLSSRVAAGSLVAPGATSTAAGGDGARSGVDFGAGRERGPRRGRRERRSGRPWRLGSTAWRRACRSVWSSWSGERSSCDRLEGNGRRGGPDDSEAAASCSPTSLAENFHGAASVEDRRRSRRARAGAAWRRSSRPGSRRAGHREIALGGPGQGDSGQPRASIAR